MRWLKIDAACAYAGGLSPKTLYAAAASGKLRVARVGAGRNILFEESWIDSWLERSANRD